jgi:LPS-assembly lipoprotein
MWSFERLRRGARGSSRRRPGAAFRRGASRVSAAAPIVLALALSGCIHPLYGPNGVQAQLSQVEVAPIAERVGHYLAEELKFQTDGSGNPPPPRYRLNITVTESTSPAIINIRNTTSDVAAVTLTATYSLIEIAGGHEVTKGTATANDSYDRYQNRYANLRAARDAEIRATNLLADQIRTRIGIALLNLQ